MACKTRFKSHAVLEDVSQEGEAISYVQQWKKAINTINPQQYPWLGM
jgi:hypothetical protein